MDHGEMIRNRKEIFSIPYKILHMFSINTYLHLDELKKATVTGYIFGTLAYDSRLYVF